METFLFIVNLIGTVAFAAAGALTGLRKNMDIFGVCVLGLTTAVGGGIVRDLILGITPPNAFQDPFAAMVAIFVSAVFFLRRFRHFIMQRPALYERMMLWLDSIGLGAFTVIGIQIAYETLEAPTLFLLVFVGVVTGAGGGLTRDVMAGDTPYIFVKHIYACASLAGALVCAGLWEITGSAAAMAAGFVTVVLLRCLSAHFRWNLPKAHE